MVDKNNNKSKQKKPLPPIQQPKDQPKGKPEDKSVEPEPEISLGDEFNVNGKGGSKGIDSEFDLEGSGSAAGLLDQELPADDTQLGGILDELYKGEGFQPIDETIKKAKDYTSFRHDDVMAGLEWKRHNRIYYDGNIAIAFVQKNGYSKTKAYVMCGYGFKNFLEKPELLKSLECKVGEKSMSLHNLIKNIIKSKYLKVEGRKAFARVYDRGEGRIAVGYSVVYDQSVDKEIKDVSATARQLNKNMGSTLEQALEYTKKGKVEYVSGLDVVGMYMEAFKEQAIEEPVLMDPASSESLGVSDDSKSGMLPEAEPDAFKVAIRAAAVDYAGQQAAKKPGVFEKKTPLYDKVLALWSFGKGSGKKPKKKQKQ